MRPRSLAILALTLAASTMALAGKPATSTCPLWQDSFNAGQLDTTRWVVANGPAPGAITDQHQGVYDPTHVDLSKGLLALTLTQQTGQVGANPSGVLSYGAMVYSKASCGYGTYEWTMQMSSTSPYPGTAGDAVSGSVSAGFIYVNNSQTEIDFEFAGDDANTLWMVNWLNTNPNRDPTSSNETATALSPFQATEGFHTYTFVWSKRKISYYVDGILRVNHTTNVPSAAARFMINHWGTDSPYWGGYATPGVTRYMYVTHASYAP